MISHMKYQPKRSYNVAAAAARDCMHACIRGVQDLQAYACHLQQLEIFGTKKCVKSDILALYKLEYSINHFHILNFTATVPIF